MQNNILFFQSTTLGGNDRQIGLFELFLSQLQDSAPENLFEQLQVVVPNPALANWLKDKIASQKGICANIDFVTLLGPVLEKFYLANNPTQLMYDFSAAKYVIYAYLCENRLNGADTEELNRYLYPEGVLDKFSAYQLASQLQQIFHEYLYLRSEELLNLKNAKFKGWQKTLWVHLLSVIGEQKTFLDIYSYFANLDIETTALKLPNKLFIFGLTSVYPSQLQIIAKLSTKVSIYWYYQSGSHEYYGDLLSSKAKSSLEKRLLKKPDLSLDDLYLTDGNPLLANLGQQSREFIELLHAHDIEVYKFNLNSALLPNSNVSMLAQLQEDIRQLKYRIRNEYRLQQNGEFYADPVAINSYAKDGVYDLASSWPAAEAAQDGVANLKNKAINGLGKSICINICHNRMREVQVMFNEIAHILNNNPECKLNDILITAPDIDDYAAYISAVFANEQVVTASDQIHKIPFNITGNRQHKNYKIIETLKLILNMPYQIPVKYFIELLMQAELQKNLQITPNEVNLVKKWLQDNATYYGYNAADYSEYGYENYPVHSFKQFLNNLTLGACFNEDILCTQENHLPFYATSHGDFTPYDNLDNSQILLVNKLITLISRLEELRDFCYLDKEIYREMTIVSVWQQLNSLQQELIFDDDSLLISSQFLGTLLAINPKLSITLPILNLFFDEYLNEFKGKFNFNGRITCASMQFMRNIPYQYIYVLGMNFGEFPRNYRPNQLSLLAGEWSLADRNYNIEDKQAFLDLILSAEKQLILSYIGRRETDNSEVKPSPLLSLLIGTVGQSFTNFWDEKEELIQQKYDFKNILCRHALHPFYNNFQLSYSQIWQQVANSCSEDVKDLRWNFNQVSPLVLSPEQKQLEYSLDLKKMLNTFLYTNANLYRVLGISDFKNEIELEEKESLSLSGYKLAKLIYPYFKTYAEKSNPEDLCHFLELKGIIAYRHIGAIQFNYYFELYKIYSRCAGTRVAQLSLAYNLTKADGEIICLKIEDEVYLEGDAIIIMDSFERVKENELATKLEDLPYALKMRGLCLYLLVVSQAKLDGEVRPLATVILRQINVNGDKRDFILWVTHPENSLKRLLSYYVRSLTNPVLIHKAAISEYVKACRDCYKNGALKNTPAQAMLKARSKYLVDWQNGDLDKIRQDMIFAFIADDYFEFISKHGGFNDIIQIGLLLAELKG